MNSGNIELKVDRIAILSSLEKNDFGVVKRLKNNLLDLSDNTGSKVVLDLFEISDHANFERVIHKLADEVDTRGVPLIHLEMHGELNKGLNLTDGDVIEWKALSNYLGIINKATGNQMIVLSNACFSLETISHFNILKPAPFAYFIAPLKEITNGYLEDHLIQFYRKLLEKVSIEKLQETLGAKYLHYFPENLLFYMVRDEFRSLSATRSREKAVTKLKQELSKTKVKAELRTIRQKIKNAEKDLTDESINSLLNIFMCGRAPYFSADDIRNSIETPKWYQTLRSS